MSEAILSIRDLSVRYRGKESAVQAVDNISLDVGRGEIVALVGESGSGKTTIAMSVPMLLPGEAEVTSGEVQFQGRNLLEMGERELRSIRGRDIAVVFQDPVAGLNPVIPVEDQVAEMLTSHLPIKKKEAKRQTVDILSRVGLSDPQRIAKSYPFQLSGGMCQRVMIGIATALDPHLLIADEPTSALDVTIQAQILAQLEELRQERGTSILLITHDFGVVAQMADHVSVMYAGRIVETGTPEQIMDSPLHPYTAALLASLPRLVSPQSQLAAIPGAPPELEEPAEHCPFLPRCTKAMSVCRTDPPPALERHEGGREVACYNPVWQG
jgi:peptide/nickel transport system ATP-binding protein